MTGTESAAAESDRSTSSDQTRMGRGVVLVTMGNLAAPVVALVTAPVLARTLGTEGRGELAAVTAPFLLCAVGLTFGIPEAVTFFTARQVSPVRLLLRRALLFTVLGAALGILSVWILGPALAGGDSTLAVLMGLLSVGLIPALVASTIRGSVRGLRLWKLIAVDQSIAAAFRLVALTILFVTDRLTVTTAATVVVLGAFAGSWVYVFAPAAARRAPLPEPDAGIRRDATSGRLLAYGLGVWPGSLAGVLLARLDQTLVLPLSTAEELGIYAVAVSVSEVVLVFNAAVRDVVFSTQSSIRSDRELAQASRISTIVTAAAALGIAATSIVGVPLLFGSEFRGAVVVVVVLLIGTVAGNPGSVVAAGLSARGRPALRSIAIIVGVLVNLGCLVVLVPRYGAVGAAGAASIANVITGYLVIGFAWRYFHLRPSSFLALRTDDLQKLKSALASRRRSA